VCFVDEEEVVEVAADLAGRVHEREDVELGSFGEGGEAAGQHTGLDTGCHLQLALDALAGGGGLLEVGHVLLQVGGHRVEGLRQRVQFVAGVDCEAVVQVTAAHRPGARTQHLDGAGDAVGHATRCLEGQYGHDGEDPQQECQYLPDANADLPAPR